MKDESFCEFCIVVYFLTSKHKGFRTRLSVIRDLCKPFLYKGPCLFKSLTTGNIGEESLSVIHNRILSVTLHGVISSSEAKQKV